jgi:uncharacterized membrane-anchored protein YhcB (DUF1043 family)
MEDFFYGVFATIIIFMVLGFIIGFIQTTRCQSRIRHVEQLTRKVEKLDETIQQKEIEINDQFRSKLS